MNSNVPAEQCGSSTQCLAAYPWTPDQGDGTYRNPVLFADYSDPDAIRDGQDYYLIASSFNCTPGLPILHSRDLINWTIINHAVKNLPDESYRKMRSGCGVWAPAIRKHNGKFWIFFPMPDEGIYMVNADHPAGEWSQPHLVQAGKGLIDPCPHWDEDGQAYLVFAYAKSRAGINNKLHVRPMSPDGKQLIGEGQIVFEDPQHQPVIEGPKFYKKDGFYYILAPAGGVGTGWQTALRSKNIYGPYEAKIVLQQGVSAINGPHQGALLDTVDGTWWFLHFQELMPYGRIVHLQPVEWRDGWPMMGAERNGVCEPVLTHASPVAGNFPIAIPQDSDEFDRPTLGLQWQWNANHEDHWYSLTDRPGFLRFHAQPQLANLAEVPGLLMQKFPASSFAVETQVEFPANAAGLCAGLAIMGYDHAALMVSPGGKIALLINNKEVDSGQAATGPVTLRVQVREGECTFSYIAASGSIHILATTLKARESQWIGARVGLCCLGGMGVKGYADFAHFRFSPARWAGGCREAR